MVERAREMLEERGRAVRVVIERNLLAEHAKVAGFLHVGGRSENEPERVVVEAASDVVVALLGERLVLVVRAPVRKLGGGEIQNSGASAFGKEVHDAEQVLVRVAKPHAAADAGLEVRSA